MAQNLRKRFIAINYDLLAKDFKTLKSYSFEAYSIAKRFSIFGQDIILDRGVLHSKLLEDLYGDK